jgi:predicted acylesterase/phospholipase RssA
VTIRQACLATSAAPTYFDSATIRLGDGNDNFVDGGLRANNPIDELREEAMAVFREDLEANLACLPSLGTGIPSAEPFQNSLQRISETLRQIATDTQTTANNFRRSHSRLARDGRYFRLNVDRGLANIGLERVDEIDRIAAITRDYLKDAAVRPSIVECAAQLSDEPRK